MASNRQQALPVGTDIEGFEIRRIIGTGGFGITYLGFDTSLERSVAIKEYCPQGIAVRVQGDTTLSPDSPEMEEPFSYGLSRFLDEARTLARVLVRRRVARLRARLGGRAVEHQVEDVEVALRRRRADHARLLEQERAHLHARTHGGGRGGGG